MHKNVKHFCAAAALLAASAAPQAAEPVDPPTLRLDASASREVAEDVAWAALVVEKESRDSAEAQRLATQNLRKAVELAKSVKGLETKTTGFYTSPIYGKDNKISGWRSRAELRIEATEAQLVSQTSADLVTFARVQGSGFFLSQKAREAVERSLIDEAVADFNSKALVTAKALGYAQTKLIDFTVGQSFAGSRPPVPYMKSARASAMQVLAVDESIPMEPGKTTVSVTVQGSVALR